MSLRSFLVVGQISKDIREESEKEKRRAKIGNNNGQQGIANATSGGTRKAAWAKIRTFNIYN